MKTDGILDPPDFRQGIGIGPGDVIQIGCRVVVRRSLVRALGIQGAFRQIGHRDIVTGYVKAWRQFGFEQNQRSIGSCQFFTLMVYRNRPTAFKNVDPDVGIAGVNEDFLLFFPPTVHLAKVEGNVSRQIQRFVERIGKRPKCILHQPIADFQVIIPSLPLKGATDNPLAGLH